MSNIVSITDLLTAIGSDNIRFQDVMDSMESIKSKKGCTVISFATDAVSPGDVITGSGPKGLVIWFDKCLMKRRLDELKAGDGLTFEKVLRQRDELLAALERIESINWKRSLQGLDRPTDFAEREAAVSSLGEAKTIARNAITKAKGGAA